MKKLKYYLFGLFVMSLFLATSKRIYFLTVQYDPSAIVNPEVFLITSYDDNGTLMMDTTLLDSINADNNFSVMFEPYDDEAQYIFAVNNFTKKDTISNVQMTFKKGCGFSCGGPALENMCFLHNGERKQGQEVSID